LGSSRFLPPWGVTTAKETFRFDALRLALALVSLLPRILAKVVAKDPDLARQIRKAASSIPLNLAEGRERAGSDRVHYYRIAFGSTAEVAAA